MISPFLSPLYCLCSAGNQECPTLTTVVMGVEHTIGIFYTPKATKNPTKPLRRRLERIVHFLLHKAPIQFFTICSYSRQNLIPQRNSCGTHRLWYRSSDGFTHTFSSHSDLTFSHFCSLSDLQVCSSDQVQEWGVVAHLESQYVLGPSFHRVGPGFRTDQIAQLYCLVSQLSPSKIRLWYTEPHVRYRNSYIIALSKFDCQVYFVLLY